MKTLNSKTLDSVSASVPPLIAVILSLLLLTALTPSRLQATDNRAPEVPQVLEPPGDTNKVHFYVHAAGVQIYRATPSPADPNSFVWTFIAPEAVLFDGDGNVVGIHYAGPTWESNSGSLVVGARVAGVTLHPTDIPWLLLRAVSTSGPGILNGTTYIQRVNTAGGVMPSTAPTQAGQEARVPYTTEYYFYRSK